MKTIKQHLATIAIAALSTGFVHAATVEETAKAIPVEFHVKAANMGEVITAMTAAVKAAGSELKVKYAPPSPDNAQSIRVTLDLKKTNLWEVAQYVAGLTNSTVKTGDGSLIIDGSR